MCCNNGEVRLPHLQQVPAEIASLLANDTQESKHFLKNLRRYNLRFQMTSFGATSVVEHTGFPTTFTIQGQVYHKGGLMLTTKSIHSRPKYTTKNIVYI